MLEGMGRDREKMERRVKVLLSKLGLDVHNRGIITVASFLKDAGMEVIYIGNALPEAIVETALQEGVDAVGVSSLGGAHLTLGRRLLELARGKGLKERTVFLIGGVFPPDDAEELRRIGFDGVFMPGAAREEIVSTVHDLVEGKNRENSN
jgi:methylmalonyl-CoA mutase C-terminal domain/subunit